MGSAQCLLGVTWTDISWADICPHLVRCDSYCELSHPIIALELVLSSHRFYYLMNHWKHNRFIYTSIVIVFILVFILFKLYIIIDTYWDQCLNDDDVSYINSYDQIVIYWTTSRQWMHVLRQLAISWKHLRLWIIASNIDIKLSHAFVPEVCHCLSSKMFNKMWIQKYLMKCLSGSAILKTRKCLFFSIKKIPIRSSLTFEKSDMEVSVLSTMWGVIRSLALRVYLSFIIGPVRPHQWSGGHQENVFHW